MGVVALEFQVWRKRRDLLKRSSFQRSASTPAPTPPPSKGRDALVCDLVTHASHIIIRVGSVLPRAREWRFCTSPV